jgi:hypothetical protein
MKSRSVLWFLAGFGVAVVVGAVGSMIALRRRVVMAEEEEEAGLAVPLEESVETSVG